MTMQELPPEIVERLHRGETVTPAEVVEAEAAARLAAAGDEIADAEHRHAREVARLAAVDAMHVDVRAREIVSVGEILATTDALANVLDTFAAHVAELNTLRIEAARRAHQLDTATPHVSVDHVEVVGLVASPAVVALRRHALDTRAIAPLAADYNGTPADRLRAHLARLEQVDA